MFSLSLSLSLSPTGSMVWNVETDNFQNCSGASLPFPWDNLCVETTNTDDDDGDDDDDSKSNFKCLRGISGISGTYCAQESQRSAILYVRSAYPL
jgi:hypothetical protein